MKAFLTNMLITGFSIGLNAQTISTNDNVLRSDPTH